jgi:serine/threonine protein kinase
MVGNYWEFDRWNEYCGKHGAMNFEKGSLMQRSGAHFTVDGERFWVEIGRNVPFAEVNLILSRELNLYNDFEVWVDQTRVNAQLTLNDLAGCSEFAIRRLPRPGSPSGWIGDFWGLEVVRELVQFGPRPVTLCSDPKTGRQVVVKSFPSTDDDESFNRELGALVTFDHPCIVPLFRCTLRTNTEPPKLATYFMPGGSLADVIREESSGHQPWWTGTAMSIVTVGIVLGMIEMHKRKMVHRDLKPSNILLDENHRPRVCDLGSSCVENMERTQTGGDQIGTLKYMAPELWEDVPYTEKVDIFSFALILYEMVVGRKVFPGSSQAQVCRMVLAGARAEIPETMDSFTAELVGRCWSQAPTERPSFDDIYEQLRRHDFCIMRNGFNAKEVAAYVDWVKKCNWASSRPRT